MDMKTATRILSKTWIPAVAGLLLLLLATSPPAFGGKSEDAVAVEACDTAGSEVVVVVSNSSDEPRTATVTVAAKVEGSLVVRSASVSLSANSVSSVQLSYRSQIEDVIRVGMSDDANPF
jgi:hypothetical protein